MDRARFEELAEAYGGAVARWPTEVRGEAQAFVAAEPEAARMILARAESLDAALDAWRPMAVGHELRERVVTRAPRVIRGAEWLSWVLGAGAGAGLAMACAAGLVQRSEKPDGEMEARSRVADLGTGHERRPVGDSGGAHRPAHRLRDVLVGLEVGVRAGRAKALDRAHDDLRIDLVDFFPREAEPLQHARSKVLHHDVALLQQVDEYLLALGALHIDGNRALVAVEHREVERVRGWHVTQLAARRVALRRLELDHVRAHPCQQLRARRPRLHVGHVEDAHVF